MGFSVDVKMSHAAAAFILQKSNEVLSMFKAFKRKANNNANAATTTQNDATNSAMLQSKRTSAVNSMSLGLNDDSVSHSDNSDASNSNIYTEINLRDNLPTKDLVTQPKPTSSNELLSSDILRFLFNDATNLLCTPADHNQLKANHVNSYVNESVTSLALAQMDMQVVNGDVAIQQQNPYEIISNMENVASKTATRQQTEQFNELAGAESSVRSNARFANINKSFRHKLKLMVTESAESLADGLASSTNQNEPAKEVGDKANLKKRLKFKLKAGLQFFKDAKVRDYHNINAPMLSIFRQ